jgi:hypothetical protein
MLALEPITIPAPWCPIAHRINPHVEEIQIKTIQWACDTGLVTRGGALHRKLEIARFGWLAALTQPSSGREDLALAAEWNIWLFARDDISDPSSLGRDPERLAAFDAPLLDVLAGGKGNGGDLPLVRTLHDICRRVGRRGGEEWLLRFRRSVRQYLQSNRWEAQNRLLGTAPDLTTYTKMRLFTGAVSSCFDVMAICGGIPAHAEFLEHPSIQLLETMANHHVCWINDIFGLRREILEGNVNNLVLVLRDELGVPLQAAVDKAVALCDAELRALLRLEARRPSFGAEEPLARRYIADLLSWVSGHMEWYSITGRYQTAAA